MCIKIELRSFCLYFYLLYTNIYTGGKYIFILFATCIILCQHIGVIFIMIIKTYNYSDWLKTRETFVHT